MALSLDKIRAWKRAKAAEALEHLAEDERHALLDSIPEPLRSEVETLDAREVGFRAGPGFVGGESFEFIPPEPIANAFGWLDRYRAVFKKAHVKLVDGRCLWFSPSGFIEVTEPRSSHVPIPPPPDDPWRPVTSDERLLDIDSYKVFTTVRFPIGRTERDRDMRFEDCRRRMAAMINAARERDLEAFSKYRFDLWVGQRLECGTYLDEMFITAAGLPLNAFVLFEAATLGGKAHVGRHPVVDGAFPDIHVANGTIENKWLLNKKLMDEWSRRFRDTHGLSTRVSDPYRQMGRGVDMPVDFEWRKTTRRTNVKPRMPTKPMKPTRSAKRRHG